MNFRLDPRMIERNLKEKTGNDFCTFVEINDVTGMSRKQIMIRIARVPALEGRPKKYPIKQVAQALALWKPKARAR